MKKFLTLSALLAVFTVNAQVPPPPAASQAEVNAGTLKNKYVSPFTLANRGVASTNTVDLSPIVSGKFYTNSTGSNLFLSVSMTLASTVSGSASMTINVDTNQSGNWRTIAEVQSSSGAVRSDKEELTAFIPPGWAYVVTNGTLSGGALVAINYSARTYSGIGTGSGGGGGLSAQQVSNMLNDDTNNLVSVVNVRFYGALGDGLTDDTLSISNAAAAAKNLRLPLYFPGCLSNTYYKVSAPIVFSGVNDQWFSGVDIPTGVQDSGSSIEVIMNRQCRIVQTANAPVFIFTNGINKLFITGGRLLRQNIASSTTPGVAFYSLGVNGGQNPDNVRMDNVDVEGFKIGVLSEASSSVKFTMCDFSNNQWPFWLVNTNIAGTVATGNNSVELDTCSWVNCWNGGYVRSGAGLRFINTESGGPLQTNFLTLDSATTCYVTVAGGNVELYNGAGINVVGASPANVSINQENWGLNDFGAGSIWNVFSTNTGSAGPRVAISAVGNARTVRNYDCAQSHQFNCLVPVLVHGSNQFSGAFTNYITGYTEMAGLQTLTGPQSAAEESTWLYKYNWDAKKRTAVFLGAITNWGSSQQVYFRNLLQYNFDLEDGQLNSGSPLSIGNPYAYFRGGQMFWWDLTGASDRWRLMQLSSTLGYGKSGDVLLMAEGFLGYPNGFIFQTNGVLLTPSGVGMATNYVAANFIPVPGMVKLVPSNNWMYSVTDIRTNAVFQINP